MYNLFRVEFNKKNQGWHHAYPHQNEEPNTFGWVTIIDECSDDEFDIFEAYVNRTKKRKLSVSYLLKCHSELKGFYKNLHQYKMTIARGLAV